MYGRKEKQCEAGYCRTAARSLHGRAGSDDCFDAMTNIIEKLGGLDKFVWVYSAYMIAMVVSTPIFGKLSDMYGRKSFFLAGLVLFMLGSILCGTAQTWSS